MEVLLAVAVAVGLVVLFLVLLALRRRVLLRPAGSIDMSLRTGSAGSAAAGRSASAAAPVTTCCGIGCSRCR